jgi:hypothetical protein
LTELSHLARRQIKSFQILWRDPRSVILHQNEYCDFSANRITYVAGIATEDGKAGKQDDGMDGTGGIKIGDCQTKLSTSVCPRPASAHPSCLRAEACASAKAGNAPRSRPSRSPIPSSTSSSLPKKAARTIRPKCVGRCLGHAADPVLSQTVSVPWKGVDENYRCTSSPKAVISDE